MKKKLILLILIPITVTASIISFYLMTKVGFNSVAIPDWYKEQSFESLPTNEFIDYWTRKAITYGLIGGIVTFTTTTFLYFYDEKLSRKNRTA